MLVPAILAVFIVTALIPVWLPFLVSDILNVKIYSANKVLPVVAACLFVVAWYIPTVHISSQTTTFQQHFVGGGVYCALLYVYVRQLLNWQLELWQEILVLFAWVSAFGVANELLEFTLTQLKVARIGTNDTDWDLLANTLGAFTGYILYRIIRKLSQLK